MTKKGNPIFTCLNCGSSFTNQRGYSMHIVNTKYCYNFYSQPGHNLSKFRHIKDLEFLKTPKAASLNQMENLVVNPTDPFQKYDSPDGFLGEVNTGNHYQIAYAEMITNPDTNFLCPIIMYMDATTVSLQSQITSHPVMFTTTIFCRQQRNLQVDSLRFAP